MHKNRQNLSKKQKVQAVNVNQSPDSSSEDEDVSPSHQSRLSNSKIRMPKNMINNPYTVHTPKSIILPKDDDSSSDDEFEIKAALMENKLTSTMWKTYKLSPLHNFKYDQKSLKTFSKLLEQHANLLQSLTMIHEALNEKVVSTNEEYKKKYGVKLNECKVNIEVLPKTSCSIDSATIKITILTTIGDNSKICFTGYLASFNRKIEHWERIYEEGNFTVLPLLLVDSQSKTIFNRSVFKLLKVSFSCSVMRLSYSAQDLKWMVASWTCSEPGTIPLHIEYAVPESKNISTIEYYLDSECVGEVWNKIHDNNSKDLSFDEVNEFIRVVENHFFQLFGIKAAFLKITSIGTSVASMTNRGLLKIFSSDGVPFILKQLTSVAQRSF